MRTNREGNVYTMTFDSLADLADEVSNHLDTPAARNGGTKWSGSVTVEQAQALAASGWDEELSNVYDLARHAVERVESEQAIETTFVSAYDVTGADVDIDRYLLGEPECMIDYPMVEIVKAGKVITLCASVCASGSVKPESFKRRGYAVTALAMALSELGYSLEIWADVHVTEDRGQSRESDQGSLTLRTLVKAATDTLDPSRIMYALAHPSMLRLLAMPTMHAAPADIRDRCHTGANYGFPADPIENLPEGTIYLPSVLTDEDIPDLDTALTNYLRQLGIVAE